MWILSFNDDRGIEAECKFDSIEDIGFFLSNFVEIDENFVIEIVFKKN